MQLIAQQRPAQPQHVGRRRPAPNGPCGAAACFTQSQVTGCSSTTRARFVIGQIIGASNYDIGHLALGQPGGGVANLGVVGRSNKARRLHRHPDAGRATSTRSTTWRTRWATSSAATTRSTATSSTARAATATRPRRSSRAAARRSWRTRASASPTTSSAHSDPYFSQRSQQEISTYTSSNQAAINEVQTVVAAALRRRQRGAGRDLRARLSQPAATIQPLTVAIGAVPSATPLGGARGERQHGHDRDRRGRRDAHAAGRATSVTIAGVANAGYNGTFTVTAVPSTRSFTVHEPDLRPRRRSGGGTITLAVPGLTESGNTVTVSTVGGARPLGRRRRRRSPAPASPATTARSRSRRCRRRGTFTVHEPDRRPRQLGRRHGDVSARRSRSGSAATTRP